VLLEFGLKLEKSRIQLTVRFGERLVPFGWYIAAKQRRFCKAVRAEIHCPIEVELKAEIDKQAAVIATGGFTDAAKPGRSIRIEVDGKSTLNREFS
jgi:hypothetical protein